MRYVAPRLPRIQVVVASILADKRLDEVLRELATLAPTFVATESTNARVLRAEELAAAARAHFPRVEIEPDPVEAVARAHELGSPVLVTGSLYLLADLSREEQSAQCRTLVSG